METISEIMATALVHHQRGQLQQAEQLYHDVLTVDLQHADALHYLGVIDYQTGRHQEAIHRIRHSLAIEPNNAEAHNNLGLVALAIGMVTEAVAAFQNALQLQPDMVWAYNNLGNALREQGCIEEATSSYQQALARNPNFVGTLVNLGNCLRDQGRVEEAAQSYESLARLEPDQRMWQLHQATCCPAVFADNDQIKLYRDRLLTELQRFINDPLTMLPEQLVVAGCEPPFHLQFHGYNDRVIKETFGAIIKNCFSVDPPAPRSGKPRVGWIVSTGHEGVFVRGMGGVFDRMKSDDFEMKIICTSQSADKIRTGMTKGDQEFMCIPADFQGGTAAIQAGEFDVLYHWEVGTGLTNYLVPFLQLAPVQCTGWGLPVTSGVSNIQYYLSSSLVELEEAGEHYSENLLCASTLLTYQKRILRPDTWRTRADFELSTDQNIYLCPQKARKIHPEFDSILAGILRRDLSGVVVILGDRYEHVQNALRHRFSLTISDVTDRIVFLPRQSFTDYLNLLALADVVLDTLHYGGALTTYDAFSLNKVIVTWPGRFARGRYTLGCYRKMGIDDWIAGDSEQYVDLAVRVGTDHRLRVEEERRIGEASNVLFEDLHAVHEYEQIFQQLIHVARDSNLENPG